MICDVCHNGGHVRQYRLLMPADGKGARGGDVMTRTHATGSAVSYGMRYQLRMIFNLAIDQDDDGNAAGYRTRGYVPASTNAGIAPTPPNGTATPADADIEARRAAVQLRNALPQPAYVIEPPSRRLKREAALTSMGAAWDAKLRAEQMKPGKFRQTLQAARTQYNERFPPPDLYDTIPDGPGARRLDHTDRGGVPAFLDRRNANGSADDMTEPSYVDLVTR